MGDAGQDVTTDTLIVGAGPIGLELAACLKRMGRDYRHVDAGMVGQTVTWYPKQTRFFSSPERIAIAGVPLATIGQEKASREEYLAYLRGVVRQFDLPIDTYHKVTTIEPDGTGVRRFAVGTTRHGRPAMVVRCDHLVLAIGDMHHPRKLDIPGEGLPHVSHYFDEPHRYFGQRLTIVGGKNSAVEAALRCHRADAMVTISYRGEWFDEEAIKYWLMPELRSLIEKGQVGFMPRTVPTAIAHESVTLGPAEGNGPTQTIGADAVLLLTGYTQDRGLFEMAGVTLSGENDAPVVDFETMRTDAEGVYVIGTAVAGTQNKFRLFIENSHPHVTKACRAITGDDPPAGLVNDAAQRFDLIES
ncbi:MAG: NAD(P)-binding domain-containing protein [Planctomycetota bacterium]